MKKNEIFKPTEKTKSRLSRHLMTFVAGANIVLGSIVLPQTTHAAVTKKEPTQVQKAVYESVIAYEKLDFTSPINGDSVNVGSCTSNSGCPSNTGC